MSRRGLVKQAKILRTKSGPTLASDTLLPYNHTKWYGSKHGNPKYFPYLCRFFSPFRLCAQRIRSHYHGK